MQNLELRFELGQYIKMKIFKGYDARNAIEDALALTMLLVYSDPAISSGIAVDATGKATGRMLQQWSV